VLEAQLTRLGNGFDEPLVESSARRPGRSDGVPLPPGLFERLEHRSIGTGFAILSALIFPLEQKLQRLLQQISELESRTCGPRATWSH
jgi:hypothetical protein